MVIIKIVRILCQKFILNLSELNSSEICLLIFVNHLTKAGRIILRIEVGGVNFGLKDSLCRSFGFYKSSRWCFEQIIK